MKIAGYIIPKNLQSFEFIISLHKQYQEKGKLSQKQLFALKNLLEIEIDFFDWNKPLPKSQSQYDNEFKRLKEKLVANRFRKAKTKNLCIIAIQSLLDENPKRDSIYTCLEPPRRKYWR